MLHCRLSETPPVICMRIGGFSSLFVSFRFISVSVCMCRPKSRNTPCEHASAALGSEILLVQEHILTAFDVIVLCCLAQSLLLCLSCSVFFHASLLQRQKKSVLTSVILCTSVVLRRTSASPRGGQIDFKERGGTAWPERRDGKSRNFQCNFVNSEGAAQQAEKVVP